jgi:hypothetical protein
MLNRHLMFSRNYLRPQLCHGYIVNSMVESRKLNHLKAPVLIYIVTISFLDSVATIWIITKPEVSKKLIIHSML